MPTVFLRAALLCTTLSLLAAPPAMAVKHTATPLRLDTPLPPGPQVKVGKLANGLTYYIQKNGKPAQKLDLGFVRADCNYVCDLDSCAIAEPGLNVALTAWRKNPPPKGGLKTVLRIPPEGWVVPEHSFFQNNFFVLLLL